MNKIVTVNTGKATHLAHSFDHAAVGGSKGHTVSCGSFQHGSRKHIKDTGLEVKLENISCKKCAQAFASTQQPAEKPEEEMTLREYVAKYGKSYIIPKK